MTVETLRVNGNNSISSDAVSRGDGDFGIGLIKGVKMLSLGETKDGRYVVDETSLDQAVKFGGSQSKGVKGRVTHPPVVRNALGAAIDLKDHLLSSVAKWKNWRKSDCGEHVLADAHVHDASPKLADSVLSLAEKTPEDFGVSLAFGITPETAKARKAKKKGVKLRFSRINAGDFVETPASTDGLFSVTSEDEFFGVLKTASATLKTTEGDSKVVEMLETLSKRLDKIEESLQVEPGDDPDPDDDPDPNPGSNGDDQMSEAERKELDELRAKQRERDEKEKSHRKEIDDAKKQKQIESLCSIAQLNSGATDEEMAPYLNGGWEVDELRELFKETGLLSRGNKIPENEGSGAGGSGGDNSEKGKLTKQFKEEYSQLSASEKDSFDDEADYVRHRMLDFASAAAFDPERDNITLGEDDLMPETMREAIYPSKS